MLFFTFSNVSHCQRLVCGELPKTSAHIADVSVKRDLFVFRINIGMAKSLARRHSYPIGNSPRPSNPPLALLAEISALSLQNRHAVAQNSACKEHKPLSIPIFSCLAATTGHTPSPSSLSLRALFSWIAEKDAKAAGPQLTLMHYTAIHLGTGGGDMVTTFAFCCLQPLSTPHYY